LRRIDIARQGGDTDGAGRKAEAVTALAVRLRRLRGEKKDAQRVRW